MATSSRHHTLRSSLRLAGAGVVGAERLFAPEFRLLFEARLVRGSGFGSVGFWGTAANQAHGYVGHAALLPRPWGIASLGERASRSELPQGGPSSDKGPTGLPGCWRWLCRDQPAAGPSLSVSLCAQGACMAQTHVAMLAGIPHSLGLRTVGRQPAQQAAAVTLSKKRPQDGLTWRAGWFRRGGVGTKSSCSARPAGSGWP